MKTTHLFVASAIAAALTIPIAVTAQGGPAPKPRFEAEKCYGIAKAGKNDCQTANSSCAGTSKRDGQGDAWIYMPAGACGKVVGGSLAAQAGLIELDDRQAGAMIARRRSLWTRFRLGRDRPAGAPRRRGPGAPGRPIALARGAHRELPGRRAGRARARARSRRDYPVSLHGVGLSLGGADRLDERHLAPAAQAGRAARARARLRASRVERRRRRLSQSSAARCRTTRGSLAVVEPPRRSQSRTTLGRRILVENPSSYLRFRRLAHSRARVSRRAGAADRVRPAAATSTTST